MKKIFIILVVSNLLLLGAANTVSWNKKDTFTKELSIKFDKNTTGFIRHQKVYKYPSWVSKMVLASNKEIFFSSPKSMFELYFQPGRWYDLNIRKESDFKQIIVTDFKTLKPIDARGAFYVFGGVSTSSAGDDLPAFATYQRAQEYLNKNGGRRILSFDKINMALINLLNGRI